VWERLWLVCQSLETIQRLEEHLLLNCSFCSMQKYFWKWNKDHKFCFWKINLAFKIHPWLSMMMMIYLAFKKRKNHGWVWSQMITKVSSQFPSRQDCQERCSKKFHTHSKVIPPPFDGFFRKIVKLQNFKYPFEHPKR